MTSGSGDWRQVATVRAGSNGDTASRGGDWRGAAIQLAATMVEMQGKEGTVENKGRSGCSGSDNSSGSKEAVTGKKGEEERWKRRLGSAGGSRNDSARAAGRKGYHDSEWQWRQDDSQGLRQRRRCYEQVGYGHESLMEMSKQRLVSDRKRLRMVRLLQRRAQLRQREEEVEEAAARVWDHWLCTAKG
ncbi:hypothetical protein BHM03_00042131 [Ensete ventricosum]|nr:hypothetical protein BHM03_00042131 [Ensete ventricosum]